MTNMAFSNLIVSDLVGSKRATNLLINDQVRQMRVEGKDIYHLGFGEAPFPVPECLQQGLRENVDKAEYLPVEGLKQLCQGIANFHCHFEGVDIDPSTLVTAPGTKELIYLVMRVFNGPVILISPGWSTYAPQVRLAGKELHVVETNAETKWKITAQSLDQFMTGNVPNKDGNSKLLIFNNPGNPSGTVYSPEELKSLVPIFKKHNMVVLSDEIYSQVSWVNFHPLMKYYPEGTITTNGFSKWASAGGWRIGYAIVPDQLKAIRDAVRAAGTHTFSCAPAPMQYACAKGLQNVEELSDYFRVTCKIYQAAANYCVRSLEAVGVRVVPGEAGYYLFPDFEVCRRGLNQAGIYNGHQMCKAMLDEVAVCLLPGSCFLGKELDLTTRLCFMEIDGGKSMDWVREGKSVECEEFETIGMPRLVEAMKRLQTFVKKYSSPNA